VGLGLGTFFLIKGFSAQRGEGAPRVSLSVGPGQVGASTSGRF
jgi:hypothetical protein